ncbi:MAG: protein-disulfide reductase DsbD family protein [Planktomarina sp.]|nr:protein-disulfide reductase DsbD family protein [Planktomarina sp.]
MKLLLTKLVLVAATLTSVAAPVKANQLNDIVEVVLLPGWRMEDGHHMAGLQINLAPGWKTYWRQPGDSGISPFFDFSESKNVGKVNVLFPTPKVTWVDNFRTISYSQTVIFPLLVQPDVRNPITLKGQVQIGVCQEICIPVSLKVKAQLPISSTKDIAILAAIQAQPKKMDVPVFCKFDPIEGGMYLRLSLPAPPSGITDATIELANASLWVSTPKITLKDDKLIVEASVLTSTGSFVSVTRSAVTTTLFGQKKSFSYTGCQGS